MHALGIALLGLLGSSVLAAQAPANGPPRHVTSTWEVIRNAKGRKTSNTIVNRRFDFGFRYIDRKPTDLLYVQELTTTELSGLDTPDGAVVIEAWASVRPDTGFRVRLWRRELGAGAARLLQDHYDVISNDDRGGHTYLSLSTGQPVFQFTEGPIYVDGGNIGLTSIQSPQLVSFLSVDAPFSSPHLEGVPGAIGLLQFTVGDSVTSRLVLTSSEPIEDDAPMPTLSLVASDGRTNKNSLTIGAAQTAVARLVWPDGRAIVVPLRGKGFTLAGAKLPTSISARLVR